MLKIFLSVCLSRCVWMCWLRVVIMVLSRWLVCRLLRFMVVRYGCLVWWRIVLLLLLLRRFVRKVEFFFGWLFLVDDWLV